MQYRPLGTTGLEVSELSLGTSPIGDVFGHVSEEDAIRTVHLAIDHGVNLIDVAPYYGLTLAETRLGKALRDVPRDRYLMATKIGRYGADRFDFSAARVKRSIDESLDRLGLDVLDIVQCHDVEYGDLDQIVEETLPALERMREAGKVRFIGITGLPLKIFSHVLGHAELDVVLSYCHYTLLDTSLTTVIPFLKEQSVGIMNASPLAMGLLTFSGPPGWHPAPKQVKRTCTRTARYCRDRGIDLARIALQYALSNSTIDTTVVGSADPDEMERNLQWVEDPLEEDVLHDVLEQLEPVRNVSWPSGRPENN